MMPSAITSAASTGSLRRATRHDDDFPRLLRFTWRLTYFAAAVGFLLTDASPLQTAGALAAFFALWVATELGATLTRRDKNLLLVFSVVGVYLAIGYAGKVVALAYISESSWLSDFTYIAASLRSEILDAFFLCTGGVLAMLAGLMAGGVRSPKLPSTTRASGFALYLLVIALLLTRLAAQVFLEIGIPGRRPVDLGVPYVAGVIAFLTGPIVFALANINLYLQFSGHNGRGRIGTALTLVLANVVLDLWVGYKQALILQSVVLVVYFLALTPHVDRHRRNVLRLALVIGLIAAGGLYKYVNDYRFALLSGGGMVSAVRAAAVSPVAAETNVVLAIGNRINGVENFYASLKVSEGRTFSLNAVFGSDLVRAFVGDAYGDEDVEVTFGLTQFGALHAVGGVPLLIVGSFILGVVMRAIAIFTFKSVLRYQVVAAAYAPILALFYLKVLFAGGELFLYAKELFLSLMVLYVIRRSFFRTT